MAHPSIFYPPLNSPRRATGLCWKAACQLLSSVLGAAKGQKAAGAGEPEVNGQMKGDEEDEEEEIQLGL